MRLLLDTTVLIDAGRRHEPAYSWLQGALRGPDVVGVCAVNITEFFAGLRPNERDRWGAVVDQLTYWRMTPEIAKLAGIFQYDFARRGQRVHIGDALVAATAVTVGATIVTDNVNDFPMPEVTILQLRQA